MKHDDHDLHGLAARAGRGDVAAAAKLRQELHPHMARIVRLALRTSTPNSPLVLRIRTAAEEMLATGPLEWEHDPDQLAGVVAHSLCEQMIGRLRPGQALNETVCA